MGSDPAEKQSFMCMSVMMLQMTLYCLTYSFVFSFLLSSFLSQNYKTTNRHIDVKMKCVFLKIKLFFILTAKTQTVSPAAEDFQQPKFKKEKKKKRKEREC